MVAVETTMWCVQLGGLNIIYPYVLRINYLRWWYLFVDGPAPGQYCRAVAAVVRIVSIIVCYNNIKTIIIIRTRVDGIILGVYYIYLWYTKHDIIQIIYIHIYMYVHPHEPKYRRATRFHSQRGRCCNMYNIIYYVYVYYIYGGGDGDDGYCIAMIFPREISKDNTTVAAWPFIYYILPLLAPPVLLLAIKLK